MTQIKYFSKIMFGLRASLETNIDGYMSLDTLNKICYTNIAIKSIIWSNFKVIKAGICFPHSITFISDCCAPSKISSTVTLPSAMVAFSTGSLSVCVSAFTSIEALTCESTLF